jgi:hypothetical protein
MVSTRYRSTATGSANECHDRQAILSARIVDDPTRLQFIQFMVRQM